MAEAFTLNAPQNVFSLFFAIFWGLVANAQIRWKAFDWPLALKGRKDEKFKPSLCRLYYSLAYLTAVPAVLYLILLSIFAFTPKGPFGARIVLQLAAAVVAAHAAFAPYRFWLAAMESNAKRCFYPTQGSPLYGPQPWGEPDISLDVQWAHGNNRTAWGYVVVCVLAALATWCC